MSISIPRSKLTFNMQYASDQNNTPLEDYQEQGKECQSLHRDQFHPATVDAGVLGSYRQAIKTSYHRKHPNVHGQSLQSPYYCIWKWHLTGYVWLQGYLICCDPIGKVTVP